LNTTTHQLADSMQRFPGPERPLPTPLHDLAHAPAPSVGRAGKASKSIAANVSVN
jgi:hypothetical protein